MSFLSAFFVICAVFFLALAYAGDRARAADQPAEEGPVNVNPHDPGDKGHCSLCHAAEMPKLLFGTVTTCVKCHPSQVGNHPVARHPIGKIPRIPTPVALPLNPQGQMVCYTCHEPHNKTRYPKLLRVEFRQLCILCHVGY